jgi:hypothetical protein
MLTLFWFVLLTALSCLIPAWAGFKQAGREVEMLCLGCVGHATACLIPGYWALARLAGRLHTFFISVEGGIVVEVTTAALLLGVVTCYVVLMTVGSFHCGTQVRRYFEQRRWVNRQARSSLAFRSRDEGNTGAGADKGH